MKTKINLGDKVKDLVTGFTGIATAQTIFLHGCVRIGVTSQELKDGKPIDAHWFDEPQLEVVKARAVPEGKRDDGGPMVSLPQRSADCG